LFKGSFYVPASVKYELVDVPFRSKRFNLEAIMVSSLVDSGDLRLHAKLDVENLLFMINSIFTAKGDTIKVVNRAEVEALALAAKLEAAAYVVDERTMRLLVENPRALHRILEGKLHMKVDVNERLLRDLRRYTGEVRIIRSAELMAVAVEKGLLDRLVVGRTTRGDLADAVLWGLRLRGCAISTDEIGELKRLVI